MAGGGSGGGGGGGCEDRGVSGGVDRVVLSYPQVVHLHRMVGQEMSINAKGSNPAMTNGSTTLTMTPWKLIWSVRSRLGDAGIPVDDIRINGSAASCVVAGDTGRSYNDLDVVLNLSGAGGTKGNDPTRHDRIRSAALSALMDFFPTDRRPNHELSTEELSRTYAHKMVKVENNVDRWSLISFQNHSGRNVELKFVDSMRRKYQFSIDSFQVIIDGYLFYLQSSPGVEMTEHFFPTVVAETFYGDFADALQHLRHKLIATRNPEEIRGGGLLKYCGLLACNYKPAENMNTQMMEKYMCARFFIDFPTIELQKVQIQNYLANHFVDQEDQHGLFLVLVINVIQRSAFCLPAHERDNTLKLIHQMAIDVTFYPELRAFSKQQDMNFFDHNLEYQHAYFNTVHHHPSSHQNPALGSDTPCRQCACSSLKSDGICTPFYIYPVFFPNSIVIPDTN